ncbi:FAD-binding oxidoreductase [Pseudohoeflea coraliihabitans]|uniref:D-lactate dehydrogenase (cytochrome) n=1 Tax=Pseudohoeflea coraliihabitans TaxID=2860393 RepID=A0ABS6WTQ6_9HYPH|nr:FAD-linked oxidase C-terminal domain-containing protein [Pseudohoeflea sp. DP4N28-3]MBW3098445.1 FAD-binding protein [Pseudohoeflea sp. DP4N28-3]
MSGLKQGGRADSGACLGAALSTIGELVGDRLSRAEAVRLQHASQLTWMASQPPDAVAFVETTDEVAAIMRICAHHRIPVIPFGAGTSFEGHVNAPYGGLSIDLSRMHSILSVNAEDMDCTIQPGVTRLALNEHLRDTGLFFPIDPGADASLGGMAATRASGTNAVRYGTMKDNVLAMTVVLPSGETVSTGSRARKSSAGYDLTRVFVGSEGTLGIITEMVLRLAPIPEAIVGGICPFPDVRSACDAVIATIQSAIPVARIEFLDELTVHAVNAHSGLDLAETPLLLLEFHGTAASVAEQSQRFGELAEAFGGGPFIWSEKPEERSRLWKARHEAYWACLALRPGARPIPTDVCVPISRLADCVEATKSEIADLGLVAPVVGHVGDGNFHVQPLVDMDNPDEIETVRGFVARLAERAITMGGTCSGEHGIGQEKRRYLEREHGRAALSLMRSIKAAIDPHNLMNPGKMLEPEE